MKILTDLHTHTTASTHSYSTLLENVAYAKKAGLEALAMTNHAPKMFDSPTTWHFENLHILPEYVEGIRIIKGIEANIMSSKGEIDIPEVAKNRGSIELCIASIHDTVYQPSSEEEFVETYENIAKNPDVDILGHIDRCHAFSNLDYLLPLFSKHNKFIEFNDFSFNYCNRENCMELMKKAKEHNSLVCINTDSHFATTVGNAANTISFLEEIDFDFNNVINIDLERLKTYFPVLK